MYNLYSSVNNNIDALIEFLAPAYSEYDNTNTTLRHDDAFSNKDKIYVVTNNVFLMVKLLSKYNVVGVALLNANLDNLKEVSQNNTYWNAMINSSVEEVALYRCKVTSDDINLPLLKTKHITVIEPEGLFMNNGEVVYESRMNKLILSIKFGLSNLNQLESLKYIPSKVEGVDAPLLAKRHNIQDIMYDQIELGHFTKLKELTIPYVSAFHLGEANRNLQRLKLLQFPSYLPRGYNDERSFISMSKLIHKINNYIPRFNSLISLSMVMTDLNEDMPLLSLNPNLVELEAEMYQMMKNVDVLTIMDSSKYLTKLTNLTLINYISYQLYSFISSLKNLTTLTLISDLNAKGLISSIYTINLKGSNMAVNYYPDSAYKLPSYLNNVINLSIYETQDIYNSRRYMYPPKSKIIII